jgi:hypothetical protein
MSTDIIVRKKPIAKPKRESRRIGTLLSHDFLLFQEPLEEFVDRLRFYRKLKEAWDLLEIEYSNSHLSLRHAARTCGEPEPSELSLSEYNGIDIPPAHLPVPRA